MATKPPTRKSMKTSTIQFLGRHPFGTSPFHFSCLHTHGSGDVQDANDVHRDPFPLAEERSFSLDDHLLKYDFKCDVMSLSGDFFLISRNNFVLLSKVQIWTLANRRDPSRKSWVLIRPAFIQSHNQSLSDLARDELPYGWKNESINLFSFSPELHRFVCAKSLEKFDHLWLIRLKPTKNLQTLLILRVS